MRERSCRFGRGVRQVKGVLNSLVRSPHLGFRLAGGFRLSGGEAYGVAYAVRRLASTLSPPALAPSLASPGFESFSTLYPFRCLLGACLEAWFIENIVKLIRVFTDKIVGGSWGAAAVSQRM